VKSYNSKYENLIESYKSILLKKRVFYPRNFNLTDGFTSSLKKEITRLRADGLSDSKIVEKLSKCVRFYL
jgi:hypothetical protein